MAAYDWVGASPARVERANGSPAETIAADGKLLSWLAGMLAQDRHYHTVMATLTASENYPSTIVRAAAAFVGGEHYFFDAPSPGHCGEWSFPRSGTLPALQTKFLAQMKRLFAADIADWRPNGGSMCEQAVVMAACKAGDAFVELAPEDGGHFGAAVLAERLGIELLRVPDAWRPDRRRGDRQASSSSIRASGWCSSSRRIAAGRNRSRSSRARSPSGSRSRSTSVTPPV